MDVSLKYGDQGLSLTFPDTPNFVGVLYPKEPEPVANPLASIRQALINPIDTSPLVSISEKRRNAVIVISDITRPVPNKLLLPVIIEQLEKGGISSDRITILIATGIHRPNEGKELEQMVGAEIIKKYKIINHFSKNDQDMTLVGYIGDKVPAFVNKYYLEADLKILTGFIEPHMWAGFSGGRKSILPGISSIKTLQFMHGTEMVSHPQTRYGVLKGNPFHEAGLDIMQKSGADFIVNVTLDTRKRLTGVFAGHPVQAHLRGVEFLSKFCIHTLKEPLDFVITTNAGAPLDCNLYQTAKGISGVSGAVRNGGVVLIASECLEGFGSEEYKSVFRYATTPSEFIEKLLKKEFFIPDQWCAQEIYQVMMSKEVWIYTQGIDAPTLSQCHFHPVDNINQALDRLFIKFGREAKWAIVPDGPMLILKVE
jgi:nickel-dependent lactate racemase